MLQNIVKVFGGDPNKRKIETLSDLVQQINDLEDEFKQLSDEALGSKTGEFRQKLKAATDGLEGPDEIFEAEQLVLEEILPEAFAAVREASKRTIGLRHYDVQLIGGITLHRGEIAEMRTGEGKTLVATLPVYLNALAGHGVHLITVNDYLSRRDARWMAPIYSFLGLSVGVLQMAAMTENGKKAFLVNLEKESPHEDQHQLKLVDRARAYRADITYGTNSEFGFDYLRDNMTMRLEDRVQRGHHYAIIDEVDNVLIDEARTPLIISGPAQGDLEWYVQMAGIVKQLKSEDYELSEKDRSVALTEVGVAHVEQLLGQPLQDPDRPEDVTPEQARLMGYLEQALRAQYLFKRNKDYLVQGGKVIIVDVHTGRLMPGRRWSDGLHQAVEAKEGVRIEPENITYATITLQNYFRMYQKLAGMTGTALTEAEEFSKIYELEVLPIPTNLEFQAFGQDASLIAKKDRDEDGYEYTYYVRPDDPPEAEPVLWKRKDYPDVIYRTLEAKLRAIVREIVHYHVLGRPMLVGTTSVESSELLSERLRAEPVRRMMQVLLVRRAWLLANDRFEDGRLIPELQTFNAPLDKVSPAELRQFAKPLNISINVEDPENISALLEILDLPAASSERLKMVMQAGVVHNVLNARRHAEESQIIAGAGEFGAVTIATNMAGRGVDIKLGGDLAEEIFGAIHRVLRRIDVDPYESTLEEQRQALLKADPSVFGIYEAEVQLFLSYFDDMEKVKTLGGLHVIGSERHEARRIDNQLRGRAARQGDPGSSRFYLSLEDDLMRMFGGEQVNNMMLRFSLDDSLPLENRMVGNIIEQSQHRVEGANFDGRKHLLEYDDVLNSQRERIYSQRNRVFTKEYLGDDIQIMLRAEVEKRVPAALEDPEGPWRLIAWLEQIQPPILAGDHLYPSFGMRLILESLENTDDFYTSAVEVISEAIRAEQERILDAIQVGIDRTGEALEMQIEERYEGLEIFLEGLNDSEEGLRAQEVSEQLTATVQLQLQLSNTQLRTLLDEPYSVEDDLRKAIRGELTKINAERLIGSIEYRLKQSLELDIRQIDQMTWKEIAGSLFEASQMVLEQQRETLVGEKGSVTRDLEGARTRETASNLAADARLRLLMSLAQGVRTGFDTRTHQQVKQIYSRFNYIFLAAQYLENSEVETLSAEVLEHLEGAQENLQLALGLHEWTQKTQNASRLADLGPAAAVLEEDRAAEPPFSLSEEDRQIVIKELGRLQLNELQRQLLLRAITEQWVDYLTKVEALRVSIGLEAYGQRDPLVQYKGRASEMFQQLLGDIRAQVIGRVFLYRPLRPGTSKGEGGEVRAVNALQPGKPIKKEKKSKKKRKRH